MSNQTKTDTPEAVVPENIRRFGVNPEEILRATLGNRFGERFHEYRRRYAAAVAGDTNFVPEFPSTVLVELLNRCNLDCIMCDSSHRAGPRIVIAPDTLEKLYAEFHENRLACVMLGAGEEPLLYESIDAVLDRLEKIEVMDVFLFTNGTLLTEARARRIVERQISRVFISLDAATPETYAKIRRRRAGEREGDNRLEVVEENVRTLIRIRKELGATLPMIRVSFCVQPENEAEADLFQRKWKNIVDNIEFQTLSHFSHVSPDSRLPEEIRWRRIPKRTEQEALHCPQPWYAMTIWVDGLVSPCCAFTGKNVAVGNIHTQSLKEIWRGEKINELRDQFRTGELNMICRKCLADYLPKKNGG